MKTAVAKCIRLTGALMSAILITFEKFLDISVFQNIRKIFFAFALFLQIFHAVHERYLSVKYPHPLISLIYFADNW